MSIKYTPTPAITLEQVQQNLPVGIRIVQNPPISIKQLYRAESHPCICLTDGRDGTDGLNVIWAFEALPGQAQFERFGINQAAPILDAYRDTLHVTFLDQYGQKVHPLD